MRDLLLSKKFVPVYFIVGFLAILLFRFIGASWVEVFLVSFLCFLVGVLSFIENFIVSVGLKSSS